MQELDGRFVVTVYAGDIFDDCAPALRYGGLTWADSIELVRLSFEQGFTVVIWLWEGCNGEEAI